MMEAVVVHPELKGLRRFMLVTRDAHGPYARYGFRTLADPARLREIVDPEVYQRREHEIA